MTKRISRRTFLLAGGAAVAAPVVVGGATLAATPEAVVARFLRASLPGLNISDDNIHGFATRFLEPWKIRESFRLKAVLGLMDHQWLHPLLPQNYRTKYDWFTRSLLTDFLLSTDFFTSAAEAPSATNYLQYSDPYTLGCRNPLARFDLE